ncbi:hypothetical protein OG233_21625 [Streptomyces sp. NBC_01218]|uniref:hypothetical protein n=1 Tax=unclassified Streptomyces TaxID=2593676 RepID=UPI0023BA2E26|nr:MULTISPECIES: hypothetical protein [unclassified Streptomyces]WEH41928.1 hypothetical protein PZB77_21870 [Streptomyces sp. AM 2-1-1]WSQ53538.1 hypothetical protein OG233_21625 [Streptomyces sp. NBC_01218]
MLRPLRSLSGTAVALAATTTFGVALLAPSAHAGDLDRGRLELTPSTAVPGAKVTASTTACGRNGAGVGDANALDAGDFDLYPGAQKGTVVGHFTVPRETRPGSYDIAVACDNGKDAAGKLLVTGGSGGHDQGQSQDQDRQPWGHVETGVGGSVGPDGTQIAAGFGVLGAAGAGALWMARRRAAGSR